MPGRFAPKFKLRTAQSISPQIGWQTVAWSLGVTIVIYIVMFSIGLYYLIRLLARPPKVQ
jgi:cytochrome d ubiquinol oxidase subunit I